MTEPSGEFPVRLEALFAASEYEMGPCFRCTRNNVQVTRVGEIASPDGETPLFACRACVAELMVMHARAHDTPVRPYVQLPRPRDPS
ncbi:hypothetical protein [Streptomyces sp. NPDC056707]|uniref:hypothetical protein n=1 Tax=Streptomyces sp. NPDC056707 TaxID=3345919 RepID=UPI0036A3658D